MPAASVKLVEIGRASVRKDDEFVDVDYRESDDRRGWNGGAFSLNRLRKGEGCSGRGYLL